MARRVQCQVQVTELQSREGNVKLENRLVNFRIQDVYHPEPREILERLYGRNILQGRVTMVMPGTNGAERFLVVEVAGLDEPLIVPVQALAGVI